jgi:putative sigma-54 modulation protein
MSIELVARDVVVTAEVQGRVEQKMEKILDRIHKETPVRLSVENSRGRFMAHLSMYIKGKEIVAQSEQKNMVAAIDEVIDRADRQCKKHYGKMQARRSDEIRPE